MIDSNSSSSSASLPVAVDAMGGDSGPAVVVEGVVQAARELGIASVLVGKEREIISKLKSLGAQGHSKIDICHASEEITMEDSPSVAIRGKPESSVRVAFELVKKGKVSSVVSAGNTGAVMAAGIFVCGTLPGIGRPAIASLVPRIGSDSPTVLLDMGANIDCHANQLVQFALMGSYYASSVARKERPKVALLSNGSESSKGNDITRATAMILSEMPEINYVGYVEGRDISRDIADVIVCDGFLGNIVLKTMEGTVELVFESIKSHVESVARGRIGMWLAKPIIKSLFKEELDASSYGGAPLLGLNEIAIICHGSSNSRAIMNAVRVAKKFSEEGLVAKLNGALSELDMKMSGVYENGMWNRMGQKFGKNNGKKSRAEKIAAKKGKDLTENNEEENLDNKSK